MVTLNITFLEKESEISPGEYDYFYADGTPPMEAMGTLNSGDPDIEGVIVRAVADPFNSVDYFQIILDSELWDYDQTPFPEIREIVESRFDSVTVGEDTLALAEALYQRMPDTGSGTDWGIKVTFSQVDHQVIDSVGPHDVIFNAPEPDPEPEPGVKQYDTPHMCFAGIELLRPEV